MELNSTQENGVVQEPVGLLAAPASPAPVAAPAQTPVAVADKKTTIQIFASTAKRLTERKKGNDTYDDVLNRDLDTLAKTGQ